jgi:PEP-CTERM motif
MCPLATCLVSGSVRRPLGCLAGLLVLLGAAPTVRASPITEADFVSPTVINFDSITTFTTLSPSTSQPFAGQGVLFRGSVTQSSIPAPFTSPSHLTSGFASGLDYIVRADFTVPVNRVGADFFSGFIGDSFFVRTYDDNLNLIEQFTGTVTLGQFSISSPAFVGLEEAQNIARVEFVAANTTGLTTFPRIDNFRFEAGPQPATVPEPGSLLLFGGLLAGYVCSRARRRCRGQQG